MLDREMLNRIIPILLKHNPQTEIGAAIVAVEIFEAMREPTDKQYAALSASNKMWRDLNSHEVWTTYINALVK